MFVYIFVYLLALLFIVFFLGGGGGGVGVLGHLGFRVSGFRLYGGLGFKGFLGVPGVKWLSFQGLSFRVWEFTGSRLKAWAKGFKRFGPDEGPKETPGT